MREDQQRGLRNVVFTNQLGVAKGRLSMDDVVERLHKFTSAADVPILCFISVASDAFRKPSPGMKLLLCRWLRHIGYEFDSEASFFCGDAAGRAALVPFKKDFSARCVLNVCVCVWWWWWWWW
jgi:DNA 3'-phosphatase